MNQAPDRIEPLPRGERLLQVDFLRGIALLGILLVNAQFFFNTFGGVIDSSWLKGATRGDQLAWSAVNAFCTFKFISLFSMMFGYGVAVQLQRVDGAHRSAWGFAARRFGMLAALGAVHGLLIWYGDILFVYAGLGVVLAAMHRIPARVLLIIAGCLAGVIAIMALMSFAGALLVYGGGREAVDPAAVSNADVVYAARGAGAMVTAQFNPTSPVWMAAETAAYRDGPFLDAFAYRSASWGICLAAAAFSYGWHSLCMMLLGMWAYKTGFWTPEKAQLRRRVAAVALSVGLPLSVGGVAAAWFGGFDGRVLWALHQMTESISALLLPAGYAVLIAGAANWLPRIVAKSVAAAGRMALSVYLLESLCATALSYWWGLAWFGTVSPAQQVLVAFCIWSTLVVVARLWLTVFAMGPMEWLWRAFTYLTLHPTRTTAR